MQASKATDTVRNVMGAITAHVTCKTWQIKGIYRDFVLYCFQIHLLEGTSVFVRVADARRDDELVSDIAHTKLVCF